MENGLFIRVARNLMIDLEAFLLEIAFCAGELYGEFNLLTSEWTDGLVPKMVRQCVNAGTEGSDNRKWIIFDGPVDAVWIENMNTVRLSARWKMLATVPLARRDAGQILPRD